MFTEHQPQALCRQFIHVSSHLILPAVPRGSNYNYSLLKDLEAEAQHRAKALPGRATREAGSPLDFFGLQQSDPQPWVRMLPLKLQQSITPIPDS